MPSVQGNPAALGALCNAEVGPVVIVTRPPASRPNAVDCLEVLVLKGAGRITVTPGRDGTILHCNDVELMLCCAWSQWNTPELLQTPRWVGLYTHPSWLPQRRGSNPDGWQTISGTTSLGHPVSPADGCSISNYVGIWSNSWIDHSRSGAEGHDHADRTAPCRVIGDDPDRAASPPAHDIDDVAIRLAVRPAR